MDRLEFAKKFEGARVRRVSGGYYVCTAKQWKEWAVVKANAYDKPLAFAPTMTQAIAKARELYRSNTVNPRKEAELNRMIEFLEANGYKVTKIK